MDRKVILLLVVGLACSGKGGGGGAKLTLGQAASEGTVEGKAIDNATGLPVDDVVVTIADSGLQSITDESGTFQLTAPAGRAALSATASGYSPWAQDVPVTNVPLDLTVRLTKMGTEALIDPGTGGNYPAGTATLEFDPGTSSGSMAVQAAWTADSQPEALPGSFLFRDESDNPRMLMGALGVTTSDALLKPVRVKVTHPGGVTSAADLRLHPLESDGSFGTPLAPVSTAGNVATFEVTHFSQWTASLPTTKGCVVTALTGTVEKKLGNGAWEPVGQLPVRLDAGAGIRTGGNKSAATIACDDGNKLFIREKSTVKLEVDLDGSFRTICGLGCLITRMSRRLGLDGKTHFNTKGPGAACAVRGSIASITAAQCASNASLSSLDFQISEGEAACTLDSGGEQLVQTGQALAGCAEYVDFEGQSYKNGSGSGSPLGTWHGSYDLTINDATSGCTFFHGGNATITVQEGTGTYELTGIQTLDASNCTVVEENTATGTLLNVVISGPNVSFGLSDSEIQGAGQVSNGKLVGTLTHPEGSGSFILSQ